MAKAGMLAKSGYKELNRVTSKRNTIQLGQPTKSPGILFGRGFMTAHLISWKVKIVSTFQHENRLFHLFNVRLARTGKVEAKNVDGTNRAFDQADN